MNRFTAYGLTFASEMDLPGVPMGDAGGSVDVTMRAAPVDTSWTEGSFDSVEVRASPDEITYATPYGAINVREGREILIDMDGDGSIGGLLPQLLGPAMGMVLHQRGVCVLHASCVAFDGRAVGVLGPVGSGKSTLAASCVATCGEFLADDVLAVDPSFEGGHPMATPGLPLLKLDGETADRLSRAFGAGWASAELDWEPGLDGKRFYPIEAGGSGARPLEGLYVLTSGEEVAIESVEPREKLLSLLGHAYARRRLEATETTVPYFRCCATLVDAVPIRRLRRPSSFEGLQRVVELVEEDVRATATHAR